MAGSMDDVKEHEIVRATQLSVGLQNAKITAVFIFIGLVFNAIVFGVSDFFPRWFEIFMIVGQAVCVLIMSYYVGLRSGKYERSQAQYPAAHALSVEFINSLSLKEKLRLYYKTFLGKTYGL